ncbi:hypothetical protein EVAR_48947_1 [Eumeta japonica]|uniref:Uncharacterized protein n=1 Tax=Eumeta variegata TaxID=151549 RepID=A0A4C1Y8P5_EUMVA|nr:hypothetical protein EVAR_48947_1 [Eumeta japonica]
MCVVGLEGIIHCELLPPGKTINLDLPTADETQARIREKRLELINRKESRARAWSEIENKTWIKIESRIGIRIESPIGIEIEKMKELFTPSFAQIGIGQRLPGQLVLRYIKPKTYVNREDRTDRGGREGVGHCKSHSIDKMQQRKLLLNVRITVKGGIGLFSLKYKRVRAVGAAGVTSLSRRVPEL